MKFNELYLVYKSLLHDEIYTKTKQIQKLTMMQYCMLDEIARLR